MYVFKEKPLVVYLAYEPYGIEYLERFIDNYKKFNSGYDHDFVICFKQFQNNDLIKEWEKKIDIDYIKFDDSGQKDDFDIGSYYRIADKYINRCILFLNTHTRPNVDNWLKIFTNHYSEKKIIAATASYASLSSQFLTFYYKEHTKFQQFRWGLKHLFNVKLFPNPHIRTTGFFIKARDLLSLNFNRNKFIKKIETYYFEVGKKGLTNTSIKNGFELLLVNSENKAFGLNDWTKSQTFFLGKQEKLILIDNRSEEYSKASLEMQKKMTKSSWGNL